MDSIQIVDNLQPSGGMLHSTNFPRLAALNLLARSNLSIEMDAHDKLEAEDLTVTRAEFLVGEEICFILNVYF